MLNKMVMEKINIITVHLIMMDTKVVLLSTLVLVYMNIIMFSQGHFSIPQVHCVLSIYRSRIKKGPWAVHITLCSDMGVGGLGGGRYL